MNKAFGFKRISFVCCRFLSFLRRSLGKFKKILEKPIIKARIGAGLSAVVLAVSIYAWGTMDGSLAWFANNKNVNAEGMKIKVEDTANIQASIKSYGIIKIKDNEYTAFTESEIYELPKHDPNEITYSQYKLALLIAVEMSSDIDTGAKLTVSTDKTSCSTDKENFLSNCIKITPATYDTDTFVAVKTDVPSVAFATKKADSIQCEKVSEIKIWEDSLSTTPTTVYFLMEYNTDFLNYINDYILNNRMDDPEVSYSNDLVFNVELT